MNTFLAALLFLTSTACAHMAQNNTSTAHTKSAYNAINQTRLDIYKASYPRNTKPSDTLTATLFLYGAGGNIEDVSKLFEPSEGELFVFAEAPYLSPYASKNAFIGYNAWPRNQDDSEVVGVDVIKASLRLQAAHLWKIVADVREKYKVHPKINIVGMSQGGAVAYHMATMDKGALGRIALLFSPTKNLMFQSSLPINRALEAFVLHNKDDQSVRFEESMELREVLQKSGARVRTSFGERGGHSITAEQMNELRAFLQGSSRP